MIKQKDVKKVYYIFMSSLIFKDVFKRSSCKHLDENLHKVSLSLVVQLSSSAPAQVSKFNTQVSVLKEKEQSWRYNLSSPTIYPHQLSIYPHPSPPPVTLYKSQLWKERSRADATISAHPQYTLTNLAYTLTHHHQQKLFTSLNYESRDDAILSALQTLTLTHNSHMI